MKALILVDLQHDFLPGGALAVPEGDHVIAVANAIQPHFELVVATQDWHPREHESFAANHPDRVIGETINLHGLPQVLWPVHCVQGTRGAALVDTLERGGIDRVFQKGSDPAVDSYSGFFDNGRRRSTGLGEYLQAKSVAEVYVMGLATDYCVHFTVLDALSLGIRVVLVVDGCRAVDLRPGDGARAIDAMVAAGARLCDSREILAEGSG
ncbi:MAG: bifunctional nicotinamidase/pyrazinamidase [Nannocystaceae bacterium]